MIKNILFLLSFYSFGVFAQENTNLIGLIQLEGAFLKNNFELLAARFEIDKADAEIIEAKLWQNPSLTINEVNLWANKTSEEMPNLFGNYGNRQQVAVDIEQIIETAGKRQKRWAIKSIEKKQKVIEFEELVLQLKWELRSTYWELLANERAKKIQVDVINNLQKLVTDYKKLAEQNVIPVAEYIRVQTQMIQEKNDYTQLQNEIVEQISLLKLWTGIPNLTSESFGQQEETTFNLLSKLPSDINAIALSESKQIKHSETELELAYSILKLEKANKSPDLTLQLSYDRGGNIMRDFVGIGIGIDLPFYNRNQAGIKTAQANISQQEINKQYAEAQIENNIDRLKSKLQNLEETLQNLDQETPEQLDKILTAYTKHLQNRQITLLEYMDFLSAYQTALENRIELEKNYIKTYEEIQYVVGKDF